MKKESWSTSFLLAVVASYCLDNVSYRYHQFLTVKSCFHSDLQIVEQTYCKLQSPIMKCEKGYIFVCIKMIGKRLLVHSHVVYFFLVLWLPFLMVWRLQLERLSQRETNENSTYRDLCMLPFDKNNRVEQTTWQKHVLGLLSFETLSRRQQGEFLWKTSPISDI